MRRFWLIFAQTVTISLAVLFVVSTLKPEWLGRGSGIVALREVVAGSEQVSAASGFREAARVALPSVVHIYTTKEVKTPRHPLLDDPVFRHFFGDRFGDSDNEPQQTSGLGSGVVVSPNGYILTNYHVVEAADDIEVALADGRKSKARIVGSDPDTDLAVLQVKVDDKAPLPAITFGQMESVKVGDVVLAIGNPFGVGQTVTMGIVSALGRSHLGINTFENFIQTDAAINPGNSGGALVDAAGNLVGINTAIYSRSGGSLGIGFAIPVSTAKAVMEQIIQHGTVTRGWIGVEVQDITPELADSFRLPSNEGALISGVVRGGPADAAGVKPGDILIGVAGRKVDDPESMLNLVAGLQPGQSAAFKLRRGQGEVDVNIKVGKRPPLRRPNPSDDE